MTDFSDQFRKIIMRYKRIGYNLNIMRQYACLRLKHNQGGHFSKSMLYVNTLLVITPIIILLSELNAFQ